MTLDEALKEIERLTQENKILEQKAYDQINVLVAELQQLRQQLQQREFDVMTFCSILGLEAEEELEPTLRKLSSEIRKLSNEKKVDSNL